MNGRAVTVSTDVELDPARAFELFTSQTEAWFTPLPAARGGWPRTMRFEPRPGGRVLEVADDGSRQEIGRVLAWEQAPRVLFSLELDGPGGEPTTTEVEVRFDAIAEGTRVSLEHRGWDALVAVAGDPAVEHYAERWRQLLSSFDQQALEETLLAFAAVFRDAVSAGDAAFLDEHMADDAVLVFPGERYRKPEVVATIGGHPPYEDVRFRDPQVVRLGPDTAILTCHVTGRISGGAFTNFESSAYRRTGGAWQLAFLQSTPVVTSPEEQP